MTRGTKGFLGLACAVACTASIHAGPFGLFRRPAPSVPARPAAVGSGSAAAGFVSSCQGVAEHMARIGRIGHFGNPGPWPFEGVGMAGTRDGAIRNCCFYGRRQLMESAAVQGSNGYWYACNRYR